MDSDVLDDMISHEISPNVNAINTILHCLSKQGKADLTDNSLYEIEERFQVKPAICSYNSVIVAWTRGCTTNFGNKAEELLLNLTQ